MYKEEWKLEKERGTGVMDFAACWDIHRSTHWRWIHDKYKVGRKRISPKTEMVKQKVIELDQKYRSSWDSRSIAFTVGASHGTVAKILKEVRGPRPKRVEPSHNRRTRFILKDVMWSSDFMELPNKQELLKTLDETSRYRLGWDISKTATAESALRHAEEIVDRFGRVPLVWKYDHGSAFTSKKFQEFLKYWEIFPYPIPPRSPWVQGRIERDNQEIENYLLPLEQQYLSEEQWEKEVDDGMIMLNFIKPRAVLNFQTSAAVYMNTDGIEEIDREWLRLDLEDIKCQLYNKYHGERLQRKVIRILLQKWGLYQEWEEIPKGAMCVNTSQPKNVSF